jgi:hypothetical protein
MMSTKPETIDVTIRIDARDAERFDEIVRALETSGLQKADVHRRFLTLNGSVAADRVADLRAIDGVASIREDRTYKTQ